MLNPMTAFASLARSMLCSIEHALAPPSPTCLDYTRLHRASHIVDLRTHSPAHSNHYPRSIGEDEGAGRIHIMERTRGEIIVFSYGARMLFKYPLWGVLPLRRFMPRGMCLRNNVTYVTDLGSQVVCMFTSEGDLISYYNGSKCLDKPAAIRSPRGVAADQENNLYVCSLNELQVFNASLPVYQTFGKNIIGKTKDVQLYNELIVVLSWDPSATIFVLTADGQVIRRCSLPGYAVPGSKPWYFDLDHYGNIVVPVNKTKSIHVYSPDGKLIVSQRLEAIERPRGVRLVNNKTQLCLTCYGDNSFCIF